MATTVRLASDSIDPDGPLLMPSNVTVTYGGPSGLAVWRDHGEPIITTLREMKEFTSKHSTFGRDPAVDSDDEKFFSTNDVQEGSFDLRLDKKRDQDLDNDGFDADTIYIKVVDAADVDKTGVDLWFNDVKRHIDFQANAEVDVFRIRTDDDTLNVRWDMGTDDRPDGAAFILDCVEIL